MVEEIVERYEHERHVDTVQYRFNQADEETCPGQPVETRQQRLPGAMHGIFVKYQTVYHAEDVRASQKNADRERYRFKTQLVHCHHLALMATGLFTVVRFTCR